MKVESSLRILEELVEISRNESIKETFYFEPYASNPIFDEKNAKKFSDLILIKPKFYAPEPSVIYFGENFSFANEFNSLAPQMIPFSEILMNRHFQKPRLTPKKIKKSHKFLTWEHLLEAFLGLFIALFISTIVFFAELISARYRAPN